MTDAPFFEIDGIDVRFGGLHAVQNFSMTAERGQIHALIGPNGAGKSTTLNCISRFYVPTQGRIELEGQSILKKPAWAIPGLGIGRTFQNIELCMQMSVLENVLVGMTPVVPNYLPFFTGSRPRRLEADAVRDAEAILDSLSLLPDRDQPAKSLNYGHQKLLDLARALASKPRLLLLDEPAAGLRNQEIAALNTLLKELAHERGIAIILIEHVMQLVMGVADRITVLNFGQKIAEGTPEEIRRDEGVIEAYLGKGSHAPD
jgi:branched-chain amino acid transport system ATP-binding protein